MRRIRFGVAASLDGYIAGPNGEYDWIPMDPDMDFAAMMAQFDTYLMGRKTYELFMKGPGQPSLNIWVFSRQMRQEDHPGITVVNADVTERLNELRSKEGKDIALYGGGDLFRSLLELGCVDTVEIAVLPILLGNGIPLLPPPSRRVQLNLTKSTLYPKTGTMLLEYAIVRS